MNRISGFEKAVLYIFGISHSERCAQFLRDERGILGNLSSQYGWSPCANRKVKIKSFGKIDKQKELMEVWFPRRRNLNFILQKSAIKQGKGIIGFDFLL